MPLERLRVAARVVVSSFLFAAFLPGASGQIPGRGNSDDGQWTMAPKDYANSRFSGLSDINSSNVSGLKLAWSFPTGTERGHEAAIPSAA